MISFCRIAPTKLDLIYSRAHSRNRVSVYYVPRICIYVPHTLVYTFRVTQISYITRALSLSSKCVWWPYIKTVSHASPLLRSVCGDCNTVKQTTNRTYKSQRWSTKTSCGVNCEYARCVNAIIERYGQSRVIWIECWSLLCADRLPQYIYIYMGMGLALPEFVKVRSRSLWHTMMTPIQSLQSERCTIYSNIKSTIPSSFNSVHKQRVARSDFIRHKDDMATGDWSPQCVPRRGSIARTDGDLNDDAIARDQTQSKVHLNTNVELTSTTHRTVWMSHIYVTNSYSLFCCCVLGIISIVGTFWSSCGSIDYTSTSNNNKPSLWQTSK